MINLEEKEIMSFLNEDGEKVDFEALARIYVDDSEYLILAPVGAENAEESPDAFAFRIGIENDKEVLLLVEDEEEFKKVKKEYKNLFYNK
jgi:uncharacterized protein YrzB (UPF0473 family)